MKNKDRERVASLEEQIRRHRELYYNQAPELSDAEFDQLEGELRTLAPESPVLQEVGAPVAAERAPAEQIGLPTKTHKIPMGSLEKVTEDRLEHWSAKAGPLFLVQEKLDGISLEIEYSSGVMQDAITRGDGFKGEVVTHNAVMFQNVVPALKIPFSGSVRGEVFVRLSVFEEHFVGRDFANPRNTVSGTVRRRHGDRSLNRYFEMRYFDVVREGADFATETEKMEFLRDELSLAIATTYFNQELEGIRTTYASYQGVDGRPGRRFELDYEIDGLVVRTDSIALQRELGTVANRPRFAMAYKFPSEGKRTILNAVDWSLGIGARVTPVARLEPVQVSGVKVRNATLHNAGYLDALGVHVGDEVLVERKGDVIPQVVRVTQARGGPKPAVPSACPTCATSLEPSGKHLLCPNKECPGKSYGDLMRWIAELEIDALGEKWVAILIEQGLVEDPADLYSLTPEDLVPLERMGEVLATKIVVNIEGSRRPRLDHFIAALNIPVFSRQRAQMVIDAGYDTLEKVQEARVDDLVEVKGFAETLAAKVVQGILARRERIERLLDAGIRISPPVKTESVEGPLSGKSFCFTGAIQAMHPTSGKRFTRKQMQTLVTERGGKALSDVNSRLDYLVLANPQSKSSKAKKARELGTELLSEEDFFALLDSCGAPAP